jgi:hypothetical protein
MPKLKNLAALAAAIEAARRYARSNPDKAAQYLDQAAAFIDKQTKGKYTTKVDGVVKQVKGAAGLPHTSRTQGYATNPGYGAHQGYGSSAVAPDPLTTTTSPSTPASSSTAPLSTPASADPHRTGDQHFPGSKDL